MATETMTLAEIQAILPELAAKGNRITLVAGDRSIELNTQEDVEFVKAIQATKVFAEAAHEAIEKHHAAGRTISIWQEGKIVRVAPKT